MSQREDRFRNIITSLIDGVLLVQPDLRIGQANLAIEEMFRRSRDSFAGQDIGELLPGQPQVLKILQTTIEEGRSYRDVEALGFRKINASTFPVSLTLSPFINGNNQSEGAVVLVRDLTLIKELEASTRQMDHLSSTELLTLGLAHEIRNPLGGIRASAQLLLLELSSAEHREYLEVVIGEVDRINRMVKRMMDLSRPGELQLRSINIHKVLEDILLLEKEPLADKYGRVIQDYDPSLPLIEADEDQLKQVFLNLIKNAIESLANGGEIRILTQVNSDYTVKTAEEEQPSPRIVVEISDNGGGIDDKDLDRLFTPFFSTKSRGSGLGLPISLRIVENHRGKIKVRSRKGEGTTFQVVLPVRQK